MSRDAIEHRIMLYVERAAAKKSSSTRTCTLAALAAVPSLLPQLA